jgi:hypothetical protein
MIDGLLVGMIVLAALAISVFFLKFWRSTRDHLFLAFAIVFAVEGTTRLFGLFYPSDTDRVPVINLLRMAGYIILIASIAIKNRSPPKPPPTA